MQLRKKNRQATLHIRPRCFYCGDVLTRARHTIDHVQPRARNGTDERGNLVRACKSCNETKRDMTLEEYRDWLKRRTPTPCPTPTTRAM